MRIWRLTRRAFADLAGEGARLHGGRWNAPGRPLVYCAADPSTAVLEVLVHLDLTVGLLPDDYVLVRIAVDGLGMEEGPFTAEQRISRDFGESWLAEGRTPLLRVPSVIVPEASNLLLNPRHADAARARIEGMRDFQFDPRLFA